LIANSGTVSPNGIHKVARLYRLSLGAKTSRAGSPTVLSFVKEANPFASHLAKCHRSDYHQMLEPACGYPGRRQRYRQAQG
jgi:hypothetical protein